MSRPVTAGAETAVRALFRLRVRRLNHLLAILARAEYGFFPAFEEEWIEFEHAVSFTEVLWQLY